MNLQISNLQIFSFLIQKGIFTLAQAMKETSFIEQNKEKWSRFERLYESKSDNPEELSNLYMDMTDDLSYAQTFYKRRTVRVYLNQLAQRVYTGVHKQKGESFKKFFTVWQTSLPLEIYRSRKNLLFALVAFLVYVGIGVITTHFNPDFPRIVLGDGYVEMTLENIQKGNPLAVYESDQQMSMFIQITTNNLKVAFFTFFVGFFFTFGTHILMFYNGVMLGAFQYFFHLKGLLITSFLGIWIHGAFEISAIVLAGGAGITAGNGLLFPKSYTRLQSLQLSTKRGLKIMLSLVPFIIAAGFLESYVTHNYMSLPEWSKWTLILFSFALILFVYVFYPMYVARKYPHLVDQEETANFHARPKFELLKIRGIGEVLADSFQFYRIHFAKFARIIGMIVVPIALVLIYIQDTNRVEDLETQHWYDWAAQLNVMMGYDFASPRDFIVAFTWTILIAIMFSAIFWSVKTMNETFSWRSFFSYCKKHFLAIWLGNLILITIMFALPWYLLIWVVFLIPFFYLQASTMGLAEGSFGSRFKKSFSFSKNHFGKSLMVILLMVFLVVIIAQPIAFVFSIHEGWNDQPLVKDLLDMLAELTKRVAREFTDNYMIISNLVRQFVYLLYVLAIIPLVACTMAFSYYSEVEKTEVLGLRKQFEKFGKRNRYKEKTVDFE